MLRITKSTYAEKVGWKFHHCRFGLLNFFQKPVSRGLRGVPIYKESQLSAKRAGSRMSA